MSDRDEDQNLSKINILKAAAQLFARLGLDKCSTREIAKQSDSNISLISYYFGGKEGLYREVMRSHALKIKDDVQEIVNGIDQNEITKQVFEESLKKITDHMIRSHLANPELSRIFAREKLAGLPHSKEIYEEIFYPLAQKFFKLIESGKKNGFVKDEVDPVLFFVLLSESVVGILEVAECGGPLSEHFSELLKNPQSIRNQVLAIILTGVLK